MHLDPLACALFFVATFTAAGLVHSAWLRSSWSRRLMMPLDGGATIRGRRVFGDNKTVRGFVVMVPATALAFALAHGVIVLSGSSIAVDLWSLDLRGYAAFGAWCGIGFMLGELPNSFIKRQLDIEPGQPAHSRVGAVVTFIGDRVDSILGMLVAASLAQPLPHLTWLYVLLVGPALHLAFSMLLFQLGVKARAA